MAPRADKYRFGIVPKRHFDPTAPLFATRRLVFRGVVYERGDRLPDDIRKGKRFALWHSNRATNTPVVHFDRRGRFVADGVSIARKDPPPPPQAAPATSPVTVQSPEAARVTYAAGGSFTAPAGGPDRLPLAGFTPGPRVTVTDNPAEPDDAELERLTAPTKPAANRLPRVKR